MCPSIGFLLLLLEKNTLHCQLKILQLHDASSLYMVQMVHLTQLCIISLKCSSVKDQICLTFCCRTVPEMLKYPFIPTAILQQIPHTLPCNTRLGNPVNPSSPIPVNPCQSVGRWPPKEFYDRSIPHILITTELPPDFPL